VNKAFLLYFFLVGISLLTLLAISLSFMLIKYRKKQIVYKNDLLKSRIEAQEESMKLISEELHDHIGQLLSLSRIHAKSIETQTQNLSINPIAHNLCSLLSNAINDLRFISHSLNSGRMEQVGLVTSIEREMEYLETAANIRCRLSIMGNRYDLDTEKNLLIFRILQELIQNVIKHAQASSLIMFMKYEPTLLHIGVKDNGVGFNTELEFKNGGLGQRNIKNRVLLLKGEIKITSEKNKGTKIFIDIPNQIFNG
jgi:signal transduction histidine kinase